MVRLYFFIRLMQTVVPWVVRAFVFTLNLMWTSIVSLWVGVPQATDSIANHWVDTAVAQGMDTIFDDRLYLIIRWMAFFTILAGWILTAHVTVWIWKLLF